MVDVEKIFKKITFYTLSKAMNIPRTTVYSWKKTNKIPVWRVGSVVSTCQRLGIDISDCIKDA